MNRSIFWFRRDLRLKDNLGFAAACTSDQLLPIFIVDPQVFPEKDSASAWWLANSLAALDSDLKKKNSGLKLYRGDVVTILARLISKHKINAVYWQQAHTPPERIQDTAIITALNDKVVLKISLQDTMIDFNNFLNKQGTPYKMFTPFWRAHGNVRKLSKPIKKPKIIPVLVASLDEKSELHHYAHLFSTTSWLGLADFWRPGERGASLRWSSFRRARLDRYHECRDILALDGTSRLSPHLSFGEISLRQLYEALSQLPWGEANSSFWRQLGWREFSRYLLYHFPETLTQPFNQRFRDFPWQYDETFFRLWQTGHTGIPVIDAAMRQLLLTGWMHNRARMLVASFLTKNLGLSWLQGLDWFARNLVDADVANNVQGWQWVAGCGADSAPYIRIFNPCLQGEKFDPQGSYIRRWLPELSRLPDRWIHRPFEAPLQALEDAGIKLGVDYPKPLVDLSHSRQMALFLYESERAKVK